MVPAPAAGTPAARVPHHGVANGEYGRGMPATGVPVRPPQPGSKPHRPGKDSDEAEDKGQKDGAVTNKLNQLIKSKTILTQVIQAWEGTEKVVN